MGRDVMDDRKRALVMGKFKFLYQDETEELETLDKFQLAVIQNKLLGPVQYKDKDGKSQEVLEIYGQERPAGEGFSDPPINIPGVLDLFTVVWTNPFGELFVDQDIKLFEFTDIQKYSTYNEGPKSKEFCQFYSSSASKELDGFDSSIFWSAGLLWKHFKTCGVEKWDIELKDLITHYKNWQEWAHLVHNLPDKKGDKSGKFSNNKFSGPATTSSHYSRPKSKRRDTSPPPKRRDTSPTPRSSLVNDPTKPPKYYPKKSSTITSSTQLTGSAPTAINHMTTPPPVLALPPPGQALTLPMMGPDGTTVQVQLLCQPMSSVPPTPPITPDQQIQHTRYSYVNPNFVMHMPPPVTQDTQWTNAVEDFLQRPKSSTSDCSTSKNSIVRELAPCKTSSPKKIDLERERKVAEFREKQRKRQMEEEKAVSSKKFKPKTQVKAPSPGIDGVNILDISPEKKFYVGTIKEWRGKFGFLKCDDIPGKIYLHSKDIKEGRDLVGEGGMATFQVLHYEKSAVGAKAVNVVILK